MRTFLSISAGIFTALIAPPALLFGLAHGRVFSSCSHGALLWAVLIAAWLLGVAMLWISGLRGPARAIVAGLFTLACVPLLPLAALSASCSAGVCCL